MSRLLLLILSAVFTVTACGGVDAPRASGQSGGTSGRAGAPPAAETGGAAAGGSSGDGGTPAGAFCAELEPEPNDTLADSLERETLDDCDEHSGTMTGTLAGADDIDFWSWSVQDAFGCAVNPTASSSDPIRLCMFAQCTAGGSVGCVSGFPSSVSGVDGCCVLAPGFLELELDCQGASDDASVWVSMSHDVGVPGVDRSCFDYQASLHF